MTAILRWLFFRTKCARFQKEGSEISEYLHLFAICIHRTVESYCQWRWPWKVFMQPNRQTGNLHVGKNWTDVSAFFWWALMIVWKISERWTLQVDCSNWGIVTIPHAPKFSPTTGSYHLTLASLTLGSLWTSLSCHPLVLVKCKKFISPLKSHLIDV